MATFNSSNKSFKTVSSYIDKQYVSQLKTVLICQRQIDACLKEHNDNHFENYSGDRKEAGHSW